jgi:hypothetical protein
MNTHLALRYLSYIHSHYSKQKFTFKAKDLTEESFPDEDEKNKVGKTMHEVIGALFGMMSVVDHPAVPAIAHRRPHHTQALKG